MQLSAVLDIGTNSTKMLIARGRPEGGFTVLYDRSLIVRLGEGVAETGRLGETPMRRTLEAICLLVSKARSMGVSDFHAVGTQALRVACNTPEFIERVWRDCGVRVRVITGEEEARFSYRAAISRVGARGEVQLVFDVGGGSTELIEGRLGVPTRRVSMPVGALTLHDAFFAGFSRVNSALIEEAKQSASAILHPVETIAASVSGTIPLIGIGGTITTLGYVALKTEKLKAPSLQGRLLYYSEVEEMIALFADKTLEERKKIPGLEEKRAEIILAGACLVSCFLQSVRRDSLIISDRGLRYGLFEALLDRVT